MNYAEQQRNPGKHLLGVGIVIVMHILLGWALVNGLARTVIEVIKGPIETKIIEETKPPPPPPENLPPPKLAPPPPSFVPPPEIIVAPPPTPASTITVTPVEPPPAPPVVIAPLAPPPPVPEPPPPAPAPVAAQPAITNVASCKPEYPIAAIRAEATGVTAIKFTIDATGKVVSADVIRPSGTTREHRLLDRAAVNSLSGCTFRPGRDANGRAVGASTNVEYVWKLE